jgi:hopanoid biosynthesis associated protein HpnK
VVVWGDYLGAGPVVNRAVLRAHVDGILTSTSLMVTGDAADEAVGLARAHPRLAVGLHLVLAQGRPAASHADIPHLVARDGQFGRQPVLAGLRYAWHWAFGAGKVELRREVGAQLEAFAATGLPLTHVDGHLNMHLHPMVLPILLELAPRYGIGAMRVPREPLRDALRYDAAHLGRKTSEGCVFAALAAYATPRIRAAGIKTADRVYGMHQTGHIDERYVLGLLASLPGGVSELYCHPAHGRAPVLAPHQPGYDNEGEVSALVSPKVRAALAGAGIALVSYPQL